MRSSSLDSISTSVSQRTLQSTGSALPHSPSLDAISQQHAEPNGKMTTKDAKGNYYVLLETASVATTECEVPSVSPAEKEEAERDGFAPGESGDKSATQRHSSRGGLESVGTAAPPKSSKRNDGNRPTLSLPADGEKCVSGGGGVSTRRATELASRKDSRLQSTNVSLFPLCPSLVMAIKVNPIMVESRYSLASVPNMCTLPLSLAIGNANCLFPPTLCIHYSVCKWLGGPLPDYICHSNLISGT